MKRLAIFTLPLLATLLAIGIGFFLFRTQGAVLKPRIGSAKAAVAEAIGEAARTLEEATE